MNQLRAWAFCLLFALPSSAAALDLSLEPLQPIEPLSVNAAQAALGKQLFFDTRLSVDNSISCAHCHHLDEDRGADGLKLSVGVGGAEGLVNSPTVFNAALNFTQFWDGRAETLEEQVDGPVTSHLEMGSSWPEIIKKLRADQTYVHAFSSNYATGITAQNIKHAIAEFERTLLTPRGRFDTLPGVYDGKTVEPVDRDALDFSAAQLSRKGQAGE